MQKNLPHSVQKNKWGLFHIAPDVTSLEDIFAQLTMLGN